MSPTLQLRSPYLIFLGDAPDKINAKTALGLAQWAPERCVAQHRYKHCPVDLGLPDMTVAGAAQAGAKSLVIGVAPVGGVLQAHWVASLLEAMAAGMDIVSGLHTKLSDNIQLRDAAKRYETHLIDVRVPPEHLSIGSGVKRSGKRLLAVGTDCAVGKKYTSLAITKALQSAGIACDFRATGQTGIMIAGQGIPIDAVVADFIAGAAETLSPDNQTEHWDIIEGQGSLFNPAYAGVSLGLLHGSQPDAIVLCHDPMRAHIDSCPHQPIPSVQACIEANVNLGRLTNPAIQCVGISVNTSQLPAAQREDYLQKLSQANDLPCVDPIVDGVQPIIECMIAL